MQVSARTKEIILRYNRFRDKGRHFYADGIR
jgi:hypothetical protein